MDEIFGNKDQTKRETFIRHLLSFKSKGRFGSFLSNQALALSRVIEQLFSQSWQVNLDGQEVKE